MKITVKLLLRTVLYAFLSLSTLSVPLFAETLEDAWKTALSVDHHLQASHKNMEAGRQYLLAAKAARMPALNFESGYTILNQDPSALINSPAFPVKEMPVSEDKSLSYKATLTVPLFTSGLISRNIDAANAALKTAGHDEKKTVLDVKLSVAESYVSVLRTKRLVGVTESNVASLSSHSKDVSNFYEQGMITRNDLLASQVALADARQRSLQAQNNLNIAHAAFNRLLGRPLDHEVSLEDLSSEFMKTDVQSLTAKALDSRPELSSLSEQSKALRDQAAGIRSSALPQLALSGAYSYQQNKYQVYEDLWSATIGLKWEVFDGGISRHNAAALQMKADALNELRSDTASLISLQVRQACLDVEETVKRIEVTREAVTQSEENLKVTKDRYREGIGTNTEVLDAESLRIRSYSNYYNAIYDAVMSQIRLKYATGEL